MHIACNIGLLPTKIMPVCNDRCYTIVTAAVQRTRQLILRPSRGANKMLRIGICSSVRTVPSIYLKCKSLSNFELVQTQTPHKPVWRVEKIWGDKLKWEGNETRKRKFSNRFCA